MEKQTTYDHCANAVNSTADGELTCQQVFAIAAELDYAEENYSRAARHYTTAGTSLHARACTMAYTWQDYGVCESCSMNVKVCICGECGQGTCDLLVGLTVVVVIFLGMVLLFGQYHAGDMFAYLPR